MYEVKIYSKEKKKVIFSFRTDQLSVVFAQVTSFASRSYDILIRCKDEEI